MRPKGQIIGYYNYTAIDTENQKRVHNKLSLSTLEVLIDIRDEFSTVINVLISLRESIDKLKGGDINDKGSGS